MFKQIKFGNGDLGIPNGEILEIAYESIQHKISSVELDEIEQMEVNLYSLIFKMEIKEQEKFEKIVGMKTALNLEETFIEKLDFLQDKFKRNFGVKRIYKPYVVKAIMLLAIEELNN